MEFGLANVGVAHFMWIANVLIKKSTTFLDLNVKMKNVKRWPLLTRKLLVNSQAEPEVRQFIRGY